MQRRQALARPPRAENNTFWDWAVLELLVQSGLRIEEACNLTAFDILRRRDRNGRTYFLLHVAPSKFDRARLIPIGDALGKVLSEIIRHVKRFYGLDHVPPVDNFDFHERKPLPRAPYLLQGRSRPNMIGRTTIREMLAGISRRAGARTHDGRPLLVHPHDCHRVFASEHLNSGTPPHVLRALLGHERLDTVMIYAKLYPASWSRRTDVTSAVSTTQCTAATSCARRPRRSGRLSRGVATFATWGPISARSPRASIVPRD